jgi:hypothetical protein
MRSILVFMLLFFLSTVNFFNFTGDFLGVSVSQRLGDFFWGVPAPLQLRRRAFRSIFACSVITPLAKDAAPIPNALAAINSKELLGH